MEQKLCKSCNKIQDIDQFFKKSTKGSKYPRCKQCLYAYQTRRWTKRKIEAIQRFGGRCSNCGYNKNYAALEFHHLDKTKKEYNWGKLRERTQDIIDNELEKCILLCSNCHRETHNPQLEQTALSELIDEINKPPKIKQYNNCGICDKQCLGKFCSHECAVFNLRRVKDRPTKDELIKMLETMNFCSIGRKYGVSDNAVRKWLL